MALHPFRFSHQMQRQHQYLEGKPTQVIKPAVVIIVKGEFQVLLASPG